jgi:hypothetical protein
VVKLRLDRAAGSLWCGGRRFDVSARVWHEAAGASGPERSGEPVSVLDAVTWLQRDSGHRCRVPVGVIGPREASAPQFAAAEWLGELLGGLGLSVICGGRQGVMEGVCRGVERAGGLSVGLLPEADPTEAAFGLQFGVPVFGLLDAPSLPGLRACPDPESALERTARVVLGLPLDD